MKKTINSFRVFYSLNFSKTIVYMLQSVEYQVGPYLSWFWRTDDFSKVIKRRSLVETRAAKLLTEVLNIGIAAEILIGLFVIYLDLAHHFAGGWGFGLAIILFYPVLWSQLICVPLLAARLFIVKPKQKRLVKESAKTFEDHKAVKIAVAGSYGKTSMKELLLTVLSEGKKVAATPANKNVAASHAVFARKLKGHEEVLVIEFGEGGPGDVKRFSQTVKPTIAIITGLSPAHLDKYKTIDRAGDDIFSIDSVVDKDKIYVNTESHLTAKFMKPEYNGYDRHGVLGWKVSNVVSDASGIKFDLSKGNTTLNLSSPLLGRHEIGPLSIVSVLAKELGLTNKQIEEGIAKTKAYEHRMQPYELSGAVVIDDTYNGNLEGIRAGTSLLKELKAKRKIYVSPGLVDQGRETKAVHLEMGKLIADAEPDQVVLMNNSATKYIKEGLKEAVYKGEVQVETDPLNYYTNLSNFVSSGDLVLMQNDWTDNYA
jgi:UDP-N-acetylmuramoyl-tripeptide--D-alanyl-D-alanine ligase